MDSPDRVRGRLCFRRNDGIRPDSIRVPSAPVTLDPDPGSFSTRHPGQRIRVPSVPVTPVPDQVRDDGPGVHVDQRKVTGDIPPLPATLPPSRPDKMDSRFRRNDGKRPDLIRVPSEARHPVQRIWVPSAARHPGRRPGVHVDQRKVAGDIPPLPATLPPSRPDKMDSRFRRNDGKRPDSIRVPSAARHPGLDPGSMFSSSPVTPVPDPSSRT
jgi:hypothetical protein